MEGLSIWRKSLYSIEFSCKVSFSMDSFWWGYAALVEKRF